MFSEKQKTYKEKKINVCQVDNKYNTEILLFRKEMQVISGKT